MVLDRECIRVGVQNHAHAKARAQTHTQRQKGKGKSGKAKKSKFEKKVARWTNETKRRRGKSKKFKGGRPASQRASGFLTFRFPDSSTFRLWTLDFGTLGERVLFLFRFCFRRCQLCQSNKAVEHSSDRDIGPFWLASPPRFANVCVGVLECSPHSNDAGTGTRTPICRHRQVHTAQPPAVPPFFVPPFRCPFSPHHLTKSQK